MGPIARVFVACALLMYCPERPRNRLSLRLAVRLSRLARACNTASLGPIEFDPPVDGRDDFAQSLFQEAARGAPTPWLARELERGLPKADDAASDGVALGNVRSLLPVMVAGHAAESDALDNDDASRRVVALARDLASLMPALASLSDAAAAARNGMLSERSLLVRFAQSARHSAIRLQIACFGADSPTRDLRDAIAKRREPVAVFGSTSSSFHEAVVRAAEWACIVVRRIGVDVDPVDDEASAFGTIAEAFSWQQLDGVEAHLAKELQLVSRRQGRRSDGPDAAKVRALLDAIARLPSHGTVSAPMIYKGLGRKAQYLDVHEFRRGKKWDERKLELVSTSGSGRRARAYSRNSALRFLGLALGAAPRQALRRLGALPARPPLDDSSNSLK